MARLTRITAEDVKLLRLVGPRPDIVARLCEAHIELAKAKTSKAPRWSATREELFTFALEDIYFGILKAANALVDDNLTYYLAGRLNRNLPKYKYKLQHASHSWDSAHAKDGRKNWSLERHEYKDEHKLVFNEPEKNLLETILSLCETEFETNVILLLKERHTYKETAEKLGCSIPWVQQVRNKIHERFKDYVRADTSDAVRESDYITYGQEPAPVCSGTVHAAGQAGSAADSLMAEY
jgi:hypothetical protein